VIDDAHDSRVSGNFWRIEREACLLAANEENGFTYASSNRVDRHQRPTDWFARRGNRLDQEQRDAGKSRVLESRDDVPDYARQLHNLNLKSSVDSQQSSVTLLRVGSHS
jgi:hypothetical protein